MALSAASSPTSTPVRSSSSSRRCGAGQSIDTSVPRESSSTADVDCGAMSPADLVIADSFWNEHRNTVIAFTTVIATLVIAQLVARTIATRGGKIREGVTGELSRVANTRLRLIRRLVY